MSDSMLFADTEDLERRVRTNDPESSWAAAAIDSDDARGIRAFILQLLRHHGPMTDEAIFEAYVSAGGTRTVWPTSTTHPCRSTRELSSLRRRVPIRLPQPHSSSSSRTTRQPCSPTRSRS